MEMKKEIFATASELYTWEELTDLVREYFEGWKIRMETEGKTYPIEILEGHDFLYDDTFSYKNKISEETKYTGDGLVFVEKFKVADLHSDFAKTIIRYDVQVKTEFTKLYQLER